MTWRRWIQIRSRDAAYLWRMVIAILLVGIVAGLVIDWVAPAWIVVDAESSQWQPSEPEAPAQPESTTTNTRWQEIERLAAAGQWGDVWKALPAIIASRWQKAGPVFLAVLTGLCWLSFAMQASQPRGWRDHRIWLPLVAVPLGVLSIWPNAFFLLWQETIWHLRDSSELREGLRDNILGVGLREELAKLLCFAPLLPILVRRRDELGAMMIAGCVGIGFGLTENINYIEGTAGSGTLGRLLIPVPAHMCLTGLLGLAAYRACVWPRLCVPQFVAMFVIVFIAHGLYDAFLSIAVLEEYTSFAILIFVGLVYQFFREMRSLRVRRIEPLTLTANFLFCVSTVAAATFAYLCGAAGFETACDALVGGIVGESIMVYLFLREMPETMVQV